MRKYQSEKRNEAKRQSREALLRAGMELFGERGLDTPSLDDICDRAGYTRGAFYVHFEDRDAFIVSVMELVGAEFLASVLAQTAGPPGLSATATRFIDSVTRDEYPLMREGGVRPHQLLAACARSPQIREQYVALVIASMGLVKQQVAADQTAAEVRNDVSADEAAKLVMAVVVGVQTLLDLGVTLDVAATTRTLLRLLAPPKGGAQR